MISDLGIAINREHLADHYTLEHHPSAASDMGERGPGTDWHTVSEKLKVDSFVLASSSVPQPTVLRDVKGITVA